jgi:hypothetical protein
MASPAQSQFRPEEGRTPGSDAVADLAQQFALAVAGLALRRATTSVTGLTGRLTDVAENGGSGLATAIRGPRPEGTPSMGLGSALGGLRDKITDTVGGGASQLMGKVTGALGGDDDDDDDDDEENGGGGGGGGGTKKLKMTVIVEHHDIGLPLRSTYDLWTQFGDFPEFMKKVESVESASDEKTNWKAKVFFSRRTWEATIVEQVPDSHIVWRSTGAKGYADGAVTFTELGPNLTRVLLVMEYHPKGLFEKTGNIWRAVGRRARLEFQHFARHAMTTAILRRDEIEGWRGEIRDSEVVRTHEEALAQEQELEDQERDGDQYEDAAPEDEADEYAEAEGDEEAEPDEPDDEVAEYEDEEAEAEDEKAEPEAEDEADEYEDEAETEDAADEAEDEADETEGEADEYEEEEAEPEPEPEPAGRRRNGGTRSRRREPARSGGRTR